MASPDEAPMRRSQAGSGFARSSDWLRILFIWRGSFYHLIPPLYEKPSRVIGMVWMPIRSAIGWNMSREQEAAVLRAAAGYLAVDPT